MIDILRVKEIFGYCMDHLNADAQVINKLHISPTEKHAVKVLGDTPGLNLVVRMPDTESDIDHTDGFAENGQLIIFLVEKGSAGSMTADKELTRYGEIQQIMRELKEWFLTSCKEEYITEWKVEGKVRTEWEYNIFGGFNGLSVSFQITDYQL